MSAFWEILRFKLSPDRPLPEPSYHVALRRLSGRMRAVGDTSAAPIPGPCADGSLGPLESDAERGMRRGEERLAVTIRSCWSASYISCQSEALEARRLIELRDRWLNPPEWVEWVGATLCLRSSGVEERQGANCPCESRSKVRAPTAAKIDRMRDWGDAVHPSACHAQGATPRSFLEA